MAKKKNNNKEGIMVAKQAEMIQLKKDYIRNLFNGRFFIARCNMMEDQLQPGKEIIEKIDGCPKSREYMISEYGLTRMQAIESFRTSNFSKKELIEKYGISEEELQQIEQRYYEGKVIDESDDEQFRIKKKAEFVNKPEN